MEGIYLLFPMIPTYKGSIIKIRIAIASNRGCHPFPTKLFQTLPTVNAHIQCICMAINLFVEYLEHFDNLHIITVSMAKRPSGI